MMTVRRGRNGSDHGGFERETQGIWAGFFSPQAQPKNKRPKYDPTQNNKIKLARSKVLLIFFLFGL
jgi:hypothetical protein